MTNLIDPPQMFTLPLSKGRDLYCEFIYEPLVVDEQGDPILVNGQPQYVRTSYPNGCAVRLVIDSDPDVVSDDATIDGDTATVLIDNDDLSGIPGGKLWRLEITYDGGIDDVLANGTTIRSDGKTK